MAFLHSLVKTQGNRTKGWCAPAELGEAAPHYVSFVIPVDEKGCFFHTYSCETITTIERTKRIDSHDLVRHGKESFVLRLDEREVWFAIRPVPRDDRRLPYVGKLKHADFQYSFAEIEPADPDKLDKLYEDEDTFIIGCEPFSHYAGIKKPSHIGRMKDEG